MRPAHRTLVSGLSLGLAALCLLGCDDSPSTPTAKSTAAESAAPAPLKAKADTTATAEASDGPICKRESQRSWGKGANPRTGLTASSLPDGRVAIGIAFGNRPHTLMFDDNGVGTLKKVELKAGTHLTKGIDIKEGIRHLQRVTVTPAGKTTADYRDKYASKRRRIACGPTDGTPPLLMFDGTPHIDTAHYEPPGSKKPKPTAKADPSATPTTTATAALKTSPVKGAWKGGADKAERPKDDAKRIVPTLSNDKPELLRELRDCRTFSDATGKTLWAVGSELVGTPQSDGSVDWTMRLFVAADGGRRRVPLHNVFLGKEPKKLHTFEAPVAHRLSSGAVVLAARYRGQMFAWLLESDLKKRGSLQKYGGGYPSLPRIVADGTDHLLLTSQKVDLEHWKVRSIRLEARHATLLDALQQPRLGEEDDSMAEPTFARAGEQRWLAFQRGDRRGGRVVLAPVNDELAAEGRAVVVTPEKNAVYESHLFGLDDGRLLLVYIAAEKGQPHQLVSEVLRCRATI